MMSEARYGDMQAFVQNLRQEGYEEVRLIDTTDDMFMGRKEARWLDLGGSTLLVAGNNDAYERRLPELFGKVFLFGLTLKRAAIYA